MGLDLDPGGADVPVVELGHGRLALQALAIRVGGRRTDRILDAHVFVHEREPALLVVGHDARPGSARSDKT